MLLDIAADLPAVSSRHHHVEQNQRRFDLLERLEGVVAIVGDGYGKPARLEVITNDMRIVRVVVDHQNRWMGCVCHKRLSEMMLCHSGRNSQANFGSETYTPR